MKLYLDGLRTPLLLTLLFVLAGAGLLIWLPKGQVVMWVYQKHTPALNVFFRYLTEMGNGFPFAVLAIVFLFKKFRYLMAGVLAVLLQTVFVQVAKRLLFSDWPRPVRYFELLGSKLTEVPGVDTHYYNAFPSGHTASAFTFAWLVMLAWRHQTNAAALFWLLALGVGLSRIYLLQHFFMDVYTGALVGTLSALMGWWLGTKVWFNGHRWQKSLTFKSPF